jgi:toxin ParE1/3/4
MASYRLSEVAKEDIIRIHRFGMERFGETQADKYINTIFEKFELIAQQPYSFEAVEHIRQGYRRCVCGSESIYFRVNNGMVEIMAIIGKQDLKNIF